MVSFSHIVAVSKNFAIGLEGKMPWHLPEDLKHFKALTMGHIIIMGRKTFDSIGKPLKGRLNIVVSRSKPNYPSDENVIFVQDLAKAFELADERELEWGSEAFVIGGGEIYRQTLEKIDRIHLTQINEETPGDTWYPKVDLEKFVEIARDDQQTANGLPYSFVEYRKRN